MHSIRSLFACHVVPLAVVSLVICTNGCQLFCNAKRTVLTEPKRFALCENTRLAQLRNAWLANRAWREVRATQLDGAGGKHYASGFRCGFAEYLMFGGDAQPPLVPPREYWNVDFETPAGKQAIDEWFQGYRHGAAECQARGNRELTTVPTSLTTPSAWGPIGEMPAVGEGITFGAGEARGFGTDWVPEGDGGASYPEAIPTPPATSVIRQMSFLKPSTAPSARGRRVSKLVAPTIR